MVTLLRPRFMAGEVGLGGLVFYAPFWNSDLEISPFVTKDAFEHSCTATGTTWGSTGRTFDGTDDEITVPDANSLYLPNGLTIEMWVNPTARPYMSKGNADGTQREWNFNADEIDIFDQSAGPAVYVGRGFTGLSAAWHHLVATWNGGRTPESIRVYSDLVRIDNSDQTNGAFASMDHGTGLVHIGLREDSFYSGIIGEVRIYNHALTISQIMRNYYATRGTYI